MQQVDFFLRAIHSKQLHDWEKNNSYCILETDEHYNFAEKFTSSWISSFKYLF